MSDSTPPNNKRFRRARVALQRATPLWRGIVIVAKAFDEGKKVIALLLALFGGGTFALYKLNPSDILIKEEAPKVQEVPPKSLAPLLPAKPVCISPTLARMRDALIDPEKVESVHKRQFRGRQHCGFHLTVADEPVNAGGVWHLRFMPRDGIRVIAELRNSPPFQKGDVVLVGGTIGEFTRDGAFSSTLTLYLQRAWVLRR